VSAMLNAASGDNKANKHSLFFIDIKNRKFPDSVKKTVIDIETLK